MDFIQPLFVGIGNTILSVTHIVEVQWLPEKSCVQVVMESDIGKANQVFRQVMEVSNVTPEEFKSFADILLGLRV